jgi:hypothetical protein
MAETVLNGSPLTPVIGPISRVDRRGARAAGTPHERPANHEGVFAFDLSQDGRE